MPEGALFVADHQADRFGVIPLDATWPHKEKSTRHNPLVSSGALAEHAGLLRFPATSSHPYRSAFIDDLRGMLVLGDSFGTGARYRAPVPAEHLAVDPSGRFIVSTAGCRAGYQPFSDVVGWCDVVAGDTRVGRLRVGEPGVAIADTTSDSASTTVAFRHREPGYVFRTPLRERYEIGSHTTCLTSTRTASLGGDGHGANAVTSIDQLAAAILDFAAATEWRPW